MYFCHTIVATIKQNCIIFLSPPPFSFDFYNYRKWNLRSIKLFSNAMFPRKMFTVACAAPRTHTLTQGGKYPFEMNGEWNDREREWESDWKPYNHIYGKKWNGNCWMIIVWSGWFWLYNSNLTYAAFNLFLPAMTSIFIEFCFIASN